MGTLRLQRLSGRHGRTEAAQGYHASQHLGSLMGLLVGTIGWGVRGQAGLCSWGVRAES